MGVRDSHIGETRNENVVEDVHGETGVNNQMTVDEVIHLEARDAGMKEESHEENNGSVRRDDPAAQCRTCRLSAGVQARGWPAPAAPAGPGAPLDCAFPGRHTR